MNLIDMHCDTLWKMIQQNEYDLMENSWSVSIPAMKEAGTLHSSLHVLPAWKSRIWIMRNVTSRHWL